MIPVLGVRPANHPSTPRFLAALQQEGFEGDIDIRYATRLSVATDNSVYQILPDAVLFPKTVEDVVRCARLLAYPAHHEVTVVARGGGTGTNGQSLSPGIVLDLSRHLARIIETNPTERFARVEPGVVLDDLNRALKPNGLFFAPTLSTSSRATLGGMISTNASGKGSCLYGRTADHTLELEVVLVGGTRITVSEIPIEQARTLARRFDVEGRLYATLLEILDRDGKLIERTWPDMPRSLTGYDLKSARKRTAQGDRVSLIPLIAGAEGTLGFIVGATLRTLPLPKAKRTVVLRYARFDDALAGAETLVKSSPSAVEAVDSRVLLLAKSDVIWNKVAHLLDSPDDPQGMNFVEFVGDDPDLLERKVQALVADVQSLAGQPGAATGIVIATTADDQAALWELRKKGVGLLGALQGDRRPVAFVEDTAVPPARLSAYVREFRQILDDAGLIYGMFGHVDAGCLHVRPALNLRDPADERLLRRISDEVVALVKKYGGVFWGEHGRGFRSEYGPEFFGEELFRSLCQIKESFDPRGQLNPGKIAIVPHLKHALVSVDALKKGAFDRQIAPKSQQHFDVAIHCNGNGQCFNTDPNSIMCPSSKYRRDRVHSPKGRATLLREWLRQLSLRGVDATELLPEEGSVIPSATAPILRLFDGRRSQNADDFSHEVYDSLDGCLSCKACATQCPIKVDVPRMKSEFLSLYHQRYARPLRDYFVASLENVLGMLALVPSLFNALMSQAWIKALMKHVVGIVDTPLLPKRGLRRALRERNATYLTDQEFSRLSRLSSREREKYVLLIQDAFTTFYEPEIVLAAFDLTKKLGYTPLIVPFFPNGKALIIKGFLSAFRQVAARNCRTLTRLSTLGMPMLGLEPAVTLTYRDEYPAVLGTDAVRFRVQLVQEWLSTQGAALKQIASVRRVEAAPSVTLMGHCTEKTMAPAAEKAWEAVFHAIGVTLSIPSVGCCGMCGVFGHEATHVEESRGVYALSWQPILANTKDATARYLISGHSCRSQIHRIDGQRHPHPVVALLSYLDEPDAEPR